MSRSWTRGRKAALTLAGVGVLLLLAANGHLVWVAVQSQPECMPHEKAMSADGYRAARSAC